MTQCAAMLGIVEMIGFVGERGKLGACECAQHEEDEQSPRRNTRCSPHLVISIPETTRGPAGGPSRYYSKLAFSGYLDFHYVLGLQAFWALLDLEFHLRAFIQAAIPVRLDG